MSARISVTIPTKNSGSTIERCLISVRQQTTAPFETIVIDGRSTDRTVEISQKYGCTVLESLGGLLTARIEGIRAAKGDIIVLLDSDQELASSTFERLEPSLREYDSLCLQEDSREVTTWVQRLSKARRDLVQSRDHFLDPSFGVLLPRVFFAPLLRKAIDAIPQEIVDVVSDRDHQIIAYEYWLRAGRIGLLPHSVYHNDPPTLRQLVRKSWRWGMGAGILSRNERYYPLLPKRAMTIVPWSTGGASDLGITSVFQATIGGAIKGLPYELGYVVGKWTGPHSPHETAIEAR